MERITNCLVILICSLVLSDSVLAVRNITASDVVDRVHFVLGNKPTATNSQYAKSDWTPITQKPFWPSLARRHNDHHPNTLKIDEISHNIRLSHQAKTTTEVTPRNNAVNFRFPNHKMLNFQSKDSYKTVDKVTEEVAARVNEVNRRLLSRRVDTDQSRITGSTTRAYETRYANHKMDVPSAQAFRVDSPFERSNDHYNVTAFHNILENKSRYAADVPEDDGDHSSVGVDVDQNVDRNVTVEGVIKFKPLPDKQFVFTEEDHTASKQIIMDTVKGVTQQFFSAIYEMYFCLRYHWSEGMMRCISSRAAWALKRRNDDGNDYTPRFLKDHFLARLSAAVAKNVADEVSAVAGKGRTVDSFDDILGYPGDDDDDDDDEDEDESEEEDDVEADDEDEVVEDDQETNQVEEVAEDEEEVAGDDEGYEVIEGNERNRDEKKHQGGNQQQQQQSVVLGAGGGGGAGFGVENVQYVQYDLPAPANGHKKLNKKKFHKHKGHKHALVALKKKKKLALLMPLLMILGKFKMMAMFFLLTGLASKAIMLSKISLIVALLGVLVKLTQAGGHRSHKTNVVFAKPYEEEEKWDRSHKKVVAYASLPNALKSGGGYSDSYSGDPLKSYESEQSYYHDPYDTGSLKNYDNDQSFFQSPFGRR